MWFCAEASPGLVTSLLWLDSKLLRFEDAFSDQYTAPSLRLVAMAMGSEESALASPKCYLEIDDPRITQATKCYADFFFHAQTLIVVVSQPKENIVETIRIPVVRPGKILNLQAGVRNWHVDKVYLKAFPTEGNGEKHPRHTKFFFDKEIEEGSAVKPKIKPPWVTNPDKFGSWRPSLLKYRDYHLIEVMIDGEKSFVYWRNLCQMCELNSRIELLDGFSITRRDGSSRWLGFFKSREELSEQRIIKSPAYSRINPPGVNQPDDLVYARPHEFDIHSSHGKANALESEYSVNRRAFAFRELHGDLNLPLDDHGYPLVKGFINGLEVYVDRESYWKECYLSISILNGMTIGLYRTNGTHELVRFTVTNEHVLKALGTMVSAWRELWPGQIPGFVCDLSSEWSAEPAVNWKNHWFDPSYGFENNMTGAEENKVGKRVPGGGSETTAHLSVREVSNGFGLRLTFGDGSRKVIHFHTADLMDGRNEIGELITVWKMFQGETVGIFQTWPVFCEDSETREDRVSWTINFSKDCVGALSKLFTR